MGMISNLTLSKNSGNWFPKEEKMSKKSAEKFMENITDSLGESFDTVSKKLSRTGSKVGNYAQQAAGVMLAVTTVPVVGTVVLPGAALAGGLYRGVEGILAADSVGEVFRNGWEGWKEGTQEGAAETAVVATHVVEDLFNEFPLLDPAVIRGVRNPNNDVDPMRFIDLGTRHWGGNVGKKVAVLPVIPLAVAAMAALAPVALIAKIARDPEGSMDSVEAAIDSVEAEAGKAMDAAMNSGYAFANGVEQTAKDVMANATLAADGLSEMTPEKGQKIVNDGLDSIASTVKGFSDLGKSALEDAGDMIDSMGLDVIFSEKIVDEKSEFEKMYDEVSDYVESVNDGANDLVDGWNEELYKLAEFLQADGEDQMATLDDLGVSAIELFGLEEEMDEFVESGGSGSLGRAWVKPHKRAGRAVKGFWRKISS